MTEIVKVDEPSHKYFSTVTVTHKSKRYGKRRAQAAACDPTKAEMLDMTMSCLKHVLTMAGFATGIRIDYGGFYNNSSVTWKRDDR